MTSEAPRPGTFGLAAAVYALRDGEILILKRGGGEASGAWAVPGGLVDEGERPEQAARRELMEEAGVEIPGPLTLVGAVSMHAYGRPTVQLMYAGDCPDGEVVISDEHSGARWIDPRDYLDRYFGAEQMQRISQGEQRVVEMVTGMRDSLEEYIAWLDERAELARLRAGQA